jgi:hypothetical protein
LEIREGLAHPFLPPCCQPFLDLFRVELLQLPVSGLDLAGLYRVHVPALGTLRASEHRVALLALLGFDGFLLRLTGCATFQAPFALFFSQPVTQAVPNVIQNHSRSTVRLGPERTPDLLQV